MTNAFSHPSGIFVIGTDGVSDSQNIQNLTPENPTSAPLTVPKDALGFVVSLQDAQPGACVEITRDLENIGVGLCLYRENLPFGVAFNNAGAPGENWVMNLLSVGDPVILQNPLWNPMNTQEPFFVFPPPASAVRVLVHYYFF